MDERRRSLKEVVQQGWDQVRDQFLEQLRGTIEGLLEAERDRRLAQFRQQGQKVYRSGYTTRKCWQTLWGALQQVRVPRLRGRQEVGLLEKYQRHSLEEVLLALAAGASGPRRGSTSSAPNCTACWPTCAGPPPGATACALPTWPRASSATSAATSAVSPVAPTRLTVNGSWVASCRLARPPMLNTLVRSFSFPVHSPARFQQKCWTEPLLLPALTTLQEQR